MLQAVILAGGKGTRLKPLTDNLPKPMVLVRGKPFLEHLIIFLKQQGFKNFLILSGYRAEQIEAYFKNGKALDIKIKYSREKKLLGTAGALKKAARLLEKEFILFNGDTFLNIKYRKFIAAFKTTKKTAMVTVYRNKGDFAKSNLLLKGNQVIAYSRSDIKNKTHVDSGATILNKKVLDLIPTAKACSLEDEVYPQLIARGELAAFKTRARFYDMGSFDGLKDVAGILKERQA
jgi:NDP-sugar pyrophosphorylase family protein